MHKAVLLDRDGVINQPILNPATNEYEAPFKAEDFKLFDGVLKSLQTLQELKYKLFVITNQPDYAKGKATLENLINVHKKMEEIFKNNKIDFSEYYYCYHHPQGIVKEYAIKCKCRKPGNLFLKEAKLKYNLDMASSWIVGDRDTDIFCGQSMNVKTILILFEHSKSRAKKSNPEFKASDLKEAVEIIKKFG